MEKNSSNHCVMKNDLPKSTVEFVSQLDLVVCDANKKNQEQPENFQLQLFNQKVEKYSRNKWQSKLF